MKKILLSLLISINVSIGYSQASILTIKPTTLLTVVKDSGVLDLSAITTLSDRLSIAEAKIKTMETAAPGTPATPADVNVTSSTFTITQAHAGANIFIKSNCTIFFVSGLSDKFKCSVWSDGGIVTFSGKINSKNGWRRLTTINSHADVLSRGGNIFNISGDLKL